jgi:serine-type D-Ala-D-Ala carboxypeptidase (penicillin-binding protein 5/6)
MRLFATTCCLLLLAFLPASAGAEEAAPVSTGGEPTPVTGPAAELTTNAQFAILMDYETGNVLFSKDGDKPMAPASMAKLMTVAILFEKIKHKELKLDDAFTVSERAWRLSVAGKNESSKMFVSIGSQIRVDDLLRGIIIQSGNDACTVVAEHFSGSEEAFADLMNAEAKKIGLTGSVFKNASGLPHPEMRVTAHDLAKLAAYIIREYPDQYHTFAEREFTWNKIKQANRNLLLGSYPGADGLKTGHTQESGYGMVASARQDGGRLIAVVNGLKSEADRAAETKRLLDIGFREFRSYALLKPGDVVGEAQVWAGDAASVPLSVSQPVKMLMRRTSREGLKVKLSYMNPVVAPVTRGQELGTLTVSVPGAPDKTFPVVAGAAVEEGGFMTQIKIGIKDLLADEPAPAMQTQDVPLPANPKSAEAPGDKASEP